MAGVARLVIYADERTDLQHDQVLKRVSNHLTGVKSEVVVVRRPMPTTLVTITWVDTIDV